MEKNTDRVTKIILNMIIVYGLIIVAFALAKSFGIINTPIWVTMIPTFMGGGSIVGGAIIVGKAFQQLTHIESDLSNLNVEMKDVKKTVHKLDKKVSVIETKLENYDVKFLSMEAKCSGT